VSEPLAVDVSGSFAQKTGQDVRVVLAVPQLPELPEPTVLRLNNGKRNVRAPLAQRDTAEGTVLESSVPAAALRPSVWSLALVGGAGAERRVQPLEARLLTSRKQPLALLPGPTPATRMPAPAPRPAAPAGRSKVNPRVRATVVRSVDGALSVLPDDVAARYRDRLGRIGRRVLG
jgi:hypothetical protein